MAARKKRIPGTFHSCVTCRCALGKGIPSGFSRALLERMQPTVLWPTPTCDKERFPHVDNGHEAGRTYSRELQRSLSFPRYGHVMSLVRKFTMPTCFVVCKVASRLLGIFVDTSSSLSVQFIFGVLQKNTNKRIKRRFSQVYCVVFSYVALVLKGVLHVERIESCEPFLRYDFYKLKKEVAMNRKTRIQSSFLPMRSMQPSKYFPGKSKFP